MYNSHKTTVPASLLTSRGEAVRELPDAELEAVAAGKSPSQGGDRTLTGSAWTGLGRSPGVASNAAGSADRQFGGKL